MDGEDDDKPEGELPAGVTDANDLLSEAYNASYQAIRTLGEARRYADGAVVLEGAYGGMIYASCPTRHLACDAAVLSRVLSEIESCFDDDMRGARVVYRCLAAGSVIAGGSGGGRVMDGLWIHPQVEELGLGPRIREALLS